jgi:hypothetical protein
MPSIKLNLKSQISNFRSHNVLFSFPLPRRGQGDVPSASYRKAKSLLSLRKPVAPIWVQCHVSWLFCLPPSQGLPQITRALPEGARIIVFHPPNPPIALQSFTRAWPGRKAGTDRGPTVGNNRARENSRRAHCAIVSGDSAQVPPGRARADRSVR